MEAEDQLQTMYDLFNEAAEIHLVRKKVFDHENGVKRKFIPDYIRKLLRKKLKLSKRKLDSDNWRENHRIIEQIEAIDNELNCEYRKQRTVEENRALNKIKEAPSYFYKYAKKVL